ncbi:MAG: hypothetical protein J5803_03295, partial [Desulfovibrio sp.]|nr:hypothetical protein [Desulfovibrio sp.]
YRNNDILSPVCECQSFTYITIGFAPAMFYLISKGVDPAFPQSLTSSMDFHDEIAQYFDRNFYEDMMVFDAIIGNSDRHMLNFGILYDNNTGEILSPSPIFDNGLAFNLDEQCCYFSREEQLFHFMRIRHKEVIESLLDMNFIQHKTVFISEIALDKLNEYLKKFIKHILLRL